jgi:hypothetical protein
VEALGEDPERVALEALILYLIRIHGVSVGGEDARARPPGDDPLLRLAWLPLSRHFRHAEGLRVIENVPGLRRARSSTW